MNIARLTEFDVFDRRSTILCLTWLAREYLGDAERKEEAGFVSRTQFCRDAVASLEAATTLLRRELIHGAELPVLDLMGRACLAARAAVENGGIAMRYHRASSHDERTDWERQHAPKAISIFKRAAEAGRQETHRALVALCELYPDAIPSDEENQ